MIRIKAKPSIKKQIISHRLEGIFNRAARVPHALAPGMIFMFMCHVAAPRLSFGQSPRKGVRDVLVSRKVWHKSSFFNPERLRLRTARTLIMWGFSAAIIQLNFGQGSASSINTGGF